MLKFIPFKFPTTLPLTSSFLRWNCQLRRHCYCWIEGMPIHTCIIIACDAFRICFYLHFEAMKLLSTKTMFIMKSKHLCFYLLSFHWFWGSLHIINDWLVFSVKRFCLLNEHKGSNLLLLVCVYRYVSLSCVYDLTFLQIYLIL